MLVFLGFLFLFHLLKAEFAVIHDLTDRRLCVWRDLDQIQVLLKGDPKRVLRGHDAKLRAILPDQTDLFVSDLLIELMIQFAYGKTPPDFNCNKKADAPEAPAQIAPAKTRGILLTSSPALEVRCGASAPSLFSQVL